MKRLILKSKIHGAKVTATNLHYEGSLSLDTDLMKQADIMAYEKVDIYNISNGERFSTYVIPGKKGEIALNGAAARKGTVGDLIIIASYTWLDDEETKDFKPKIVILSTE